MKLTAAERKDIVGSVLKEAAKANRFLKSKAGGQEPTYEEADAYFNLLPPKALPAKAYNRANWPKIRRAMESQIVKHLFEKHQIDP